MRSAKRKYLAEDAAGLDTGAAAAKLKAARQSLAQFVQATGGRQDSARESVSGFGRSAAGKATWAARKPTNFTDTGKRSILNQATQNTSKGVSNIEITRIGQIDPAPLQAFFGELRTVDVIVTNERIAHIQERHPQDYALFQQYGAQAIEHPDLILQDTKHLGTIFVIRRLPETNLNVIVRLALNTDDPAHKNSVMTFYRIRDKNLDNLQEKFPLLYKRE